MTTPVESANLILRLFELRRETVMRQARAWYTGDFNPTTFEEFLALAGGPNNPWFRMVVGYWDMAATLVQFKAIDQDMFNATSGEMVVVFAKLEPFLNEYRAHRGEPNFLKRLETQVQTMPNVTERLPKIRERFRKAAEARANSAKRSKKR
jgi:hypothetical protein